MSLKCITLGKMNKFIFLVLLNSIVYACLFNFEWNTIIFYYHPIGYLIIYSFGLCLSIFLLLINKIRSKRKRKKIISQEKNPYLINSTKIKEVAKKEKFLWILLVSVIDFILNIINNCYINKILFLENNLVFGILFLSLFSYKILNYKLYKHHYLTIIIVFICFLILTIIQFFSFKNRLVFFILSIIDVGTMALYSLELTIVKYLMFSKYINSFEILFFQGSIELIFGTILLIITTKYNFIDNFWNYYYQIDKKEVIFLILLIIFNFIYHSLIITIIDILSPFFILFIPVISIVIYYFLFSSLGLKNFPDVYKIFLYLLAFFVLLIFTEIIELNCFGLSYMTKRNIELRAKLDFITEGDEEVRIDSEIGLQGYTIELNEFKQEEKLITDDTESSKED